MGSTVAVGTGAPLAGVAVGFRSVAVLVDAAISLHAAIPGRMASGASDATALDSTIRFPPLLVEPSYSFVMTGSYDRCTRPPNLDQSLP